MTKSNSVCVAAVSLCVGSFGLVSMGCEFLVQLDRSAIDAGGDAGCAICSDASAGSNDADATSDADTPTPDGEAEASTDSGADADADADTDSGG